MANTLRDFNKQAGKLRISLNSTAEKEETKTEEAKRVVNTAKKKTAEVKDVVEVTEKKLKKQSIDSLHRAYKPPRGTLSQKPLTPIT